MILSSVRDISCFDLFGSPTLLCYAMLYQQHVMHFLQHFMQFFHSFICGKRRNYAVSIHLSRKFDLDLLHCVVGTNELK